MKCLKCLRTLLVKRTVEIDKATAKRWLVSVCAFCGYGHDLEEFDPILHSYLKWDWSREK